MTKTPTQVGTLQCFASKRNASRRSQIANIVMTVALAALAVSPAFAQRAQLEPEGSTGQTSRTAVVAQKHMVSTANALASEAAREMLRAGGSAVDAAIAAQLILGLVEPQSSGLGGGAFVLFWDNASQKLTALDGRETAPATAQPERFVKDGKRMPFDVAVHSGLSTGTPGTVKVLEDAHRRFGKLSWQKLFEPALKLARDGFTVSRRLNLLLRYYGPDAFNKTARDYFFDASGSPRAEGFLLENGAYAEVLKKISAEGSAAFYKGDVAQSIVAAVKAAPNAPGDLALSDFETYAVKERSTVCAPYRSYKVCGIGPPSSGGIAIAQILQIIEPFDLGRGPDAALNASALHLIVEAQRLAYADRGLYVADPDFVPVPEGLSNAEYAATRRSLISPDTAMSEVKPGEPPGTKKADFGDDSTIERAGTSHISVVDADGNAVAMTTTIEGAFGSGVMASGFLLNNELTDFSFQPTGPNGHPAANRVEGGKRPRSSMTPTIVFDDKNQVFAVLGSPGGSRIILYVTKAIVGLIDWRLDAQQATALTNFGSMGGAVELEYDWRSVFNALKLRNYGHQTSFDLMNSGLNIIVKRGANLEGGSDPRREGAALGD